MQNFQEHADGCFWKFEKCLSWTNVYPKIKQHRAQSNLKKKKKKLPSSYHEKNALRKRLATKIMFSSNLFSCLFFCYWHGKYVLDTPWKVSKCGVISGQSFPIFGLNMEIYSVNLEIYSVFSPNIRKYGPEITPYLDTFHAVRIFLSVMFY